MASALVPAAGSASRFGGGKLLAPVDGIPMLDRTLGTLLEAGADHVLVVLPPDVTWIGRLECLQDPRVRTTTNPDPSRGMFSSIQLGLADLTEPPLAVLPGDMPFVRATTVTALLDLAGRTGGIVSPRFNGRRGHPVLLPADVRDAVVAAPVSARLDDVLKPFASRFVDLDVSDPGVVRDVDVAEDLST